VNRQEPLISIIVPVYQVKAYLEKCVRSLQDQTYRNLEILLIDDGSLDGSQDLCDRLAAEDERIVVCHQENAGPSAARNRGLAMATGAYIGFADSDDFVDPNMYELLYQGICQFQVAAAQVGRQELSASGAVLPDICEPPSEATFLLAEDFLRELLMHKGDCSFCTKLFDREILKDKRFPEGVLNEDFRLLIELLDELPGIVSLPEQAYHVLYRSDSNTRKKDSQTFSRVFADGVENADWVTEEVREKYPALMEVALRFGVFQRLEYLLHIPISQMTDDNLTFRNIISWLRKHYREALGNPWLTHKNKLYLSLFVLAPKQIRLLHRRIRSIK
jgi:glycosyltransferase involved in cell wall biosynthesis